MVRFEVAVAWFFASGLRTQLWYHSSPSFTGKYQGKTRRWSLVRLKTSRFFLNCERLEKAIKLQVAHLDEDNGK
jgi:hypothetical protein